MGFPFGDHVREVAAEATEALDLTVEEAEERAQQAWEVIALAQRERFKHVVLSSAEHWSDEMVLGAAVLSMIVIASYEEVSTEDPGPHDVLRAAQEFSCLAAGLRDALTTDAFADRAERASEGLGGVPFPDQVAAEAEGHVEGVAVFHDVLVTLFGPERAQIIFDAIDAEDRAKGDQGD